MADEGNADVVEETTEPSTDSVQMTEVNEEAVGKLHETIDKLNLVLDHLERKNGDIYSRMEVLLASIKQCKTEDK